MALMIPLQIPDKATPGEKHVFNQLQKFLSSDYICWFELPIKDRGEVRYPDFITIGPDIGLVAIEVKDWSLDNIAEANPDIITLRTPQGDKSRENPSKQARQYSLLLNNKLQRSKNPFLVENEGRNKDKLKFPYTWCVVFPNINSQAFFQHPFSQVLQTDFVICSDELPNIKQRFLTLAQKQFRATLDAQQLMEIRQILYPEIKIAEDKQLDVAQEAIAKLNISDYDELESKGKNLAEKLTVTLIKGAPGSGKTMILLFRAIYLHRVFPNKKILFLTFNKNLASHLTEKYINIEREQYKDEPSHISNLQSGRLTIYNFHSWCMKLLRTYGSSKYNIFEDTSGLVKNILFNQQIDWPNIDAEFVNEEIAWMKEHEILNWEAYRKVERTGRVIPLNEAQRQFVWRTFETYNAKLQDIHQIDWADVPLEVLRQIRNSPLPQAFQYDFILIDEGQDFAPVWYKVINELRKSKDVPITVAADVMQKIYERAFTWKEVGIKINPTSSKRLLYAYRTTPQILTAAVGIIRGEEAIADIVKTLDEDTFKDPRIAPGARNGPLPILCAYQNPSSEAKQIANEIIRLHDTFKVDDKRELLWEDILVLARNRQTLREIANVLSNSNIPVKFQIDNEDRISLLTIHGAKGIEAPVVFICGLDKVNDGLKLHLSERAEKLREAREKQLLYVGMTRAQSRLYMSYSGKVPDWILNKLVNITDAKQLVEFNNLAAMPDQK